MLEIFTLRAIFFVRPHRTSAWSRRSRLRATLLTATLIDKTHAFETCFFYFRFCAKLCPSKLCAGIANASLAGFVPETFVRRRGER